jgi:hypothetical protein
MFMPPVAGGVINRRRRFVAAKGPVIPDIGPNMPLDRLAFRQAPLPEDSPGYGSEGNVVTMKQESCNSTMRSGNAEAAIPGNPAGFPVSSWRISRT